LIYNRVQLTLVQQEAFKRGLYFGVRSIKVLAEDGKKELNWSTIYTCAAMMELDSKQKKPNYPDPNKPSFKSEDGFWGTLFKYWEVIFEPQTHLPMRI